MTFTLRDATFCSSTGEGVNSYIIIYRDMVTIHLILAIYGPVIFLLICPVCNAFNPLPSGTLATFFLTAVGPIQHTKEGDISREKTILMTSLRLERAAAVR